MSELEICKYCGKPIMRGEVWNPDENGNGYHHACLIDIEFNENKKRVERLAQKSILNKIRAEIEEIELNITYQENKDRKATWGLRKALEIIDKYKAEGKPQTKTGHWKRISMDKYSEHAKYWYRCDRCGKDNLGDTDWCPNCGCRMVEPQERNEE